MRICKQAALLLALAGPALAGDPNIVVLGMMPDRAILKIDGEQVLLRVGESHNGIELKSVNSLDAVLTVNGHERHFDLGMDTGGVTNPAQDSIDIPLSRHGYVSSGFINGQVVDFVVDTGADEVSLTTADAARLGIDYSAGHQGFGHTAGGVVRIWFVTLDSVKIGPIELHQVDAHVREGDPGAPILLGMSFLRRVTVTQANDSLRLSTR